MDKGVGRVVTAGAVGRTQPAFEADLPLGSSCMGVRLKRSVRRLFKDTMMRSHWLIRALTLITTFSLSVALTGFFTRYERPLTFSCDGISSAFQTRYHSSDGLALRYGCYEHGSPAEAEAELQEEVGMKYRQSAEGQLIKVGIIEQTTLHERNGRKTGVRSVLDDAEILWTEGPRLHRISGPSVRHTRLFEQSRAWAWQVCNGRFIVQRVGNFSASLKSTFRLRVGMTPSAK